MDDALLSNTLDDAHRAGELLLGALDVAIIERVLDALDLVAHHAAVVTVALAALHVLLVALDGIFVVSQGSALFSIFGCARWRVVDSISEAAAIVVHAPIGARLS